MDCAAPERRAIWDMTKSLWRAAGYVWHAVTFEDILGMGMRAPTINGPDTRPPTARLWRILLSESVYLVWCFRCTRVIEHEGDPGWRHTASAVSSSWTRTLNKRLRQDAAAAHPRMGRLALAPSLVKDTWKSVIKVQNDDGVDWVRNIHRVLVGIDPHIVASTRGDQSPTLA